MISLICLAKMVSAMKKSYIRDERFKTEFLKIIGERNKEIVPICEMIIEALEGGEDCDKIVTFSFVSSFLSVMMLSTFDVASLINVKLGCKYRSEVISILLCPMRFFKVSRSVPFSNCIMAKVCLKSWKRQTGRLLAT